MSDSEPPKPHHEDEPSMEGAGIRQTVFGVPHSMWLSKGELSLKQQERIASGVENIAQNLYDAAMDQSADRERMLDKLDEARDVMQKGFEDYMFGAERDQDEQMGALHALDDELETANRRLRKISHGIDDLNDGVEDLVEVSSDIEYGVRGIRRDLRSGLGELIDVTEEGNAVLIELADTSDRTSDLVSELVNLAIRQIKEQVQTRDQFLQALRRTVAEVLVFLEVSRKDLRAGMIGLKRELIRIGKIQSRGIQKSESIKAGQYRDQGIALFEKGIPEEAKECLLSAFALNRVDFQTNRYLALVTEGKERDRYLRLARALANSREEKHQLASILEKDVFSKNDANEKHKLLIEILTLDPSFFYKDRSSFKTFLQDMDLDEIFEKVLVPLVNGNKDNISIVMAALLMAGKERSDLDALYTTYVEKFSEVRIDPLLREKSKSNKRVAGKLTKAVYDKKQRLAVNGVLVKWLAYMDEVSPEVTGELVELVYFNDPGIQSARKEKPVNYKKIADYLKISLGSKVGSLKGYCLLPKQVRSLF